MLMRYELQKVFSKRANQIIVILLILLVVYCSANALHNLEWVDPEGNWITGHSAAVKLMESRKQWSGPLDQEMLEKALVEIKEIYNSTESETYTVGENWAMRSQLQGVQEIADLIGWSFVEDYSTFDELVTNLQAEDLSQFYENRIEERKEWLYDKTSWAYYNYSDEEKQYVLNQYASLEIPMDIGYHEGWVQASENIPTLLKYGIILLSFVLAGIFSDEFSLKTSAVYYNTLYGRTRATGVKVGAGFLTITVTYWLYVGIYSLIVLGSLGTGGGNCSIQSHAEYWYIRENMTFREYYCLALAAGYIGYLLLGSLVMWISAKTKSPVLAVLIPSLVILLPDYLSGYRGNFMYYIIGLLPDRLLDISQAIQYLCLYTIGDNIMTAVPILLTIYPCLTVVLVFLCYHEYRHKQIA